MKKNISVGVSVSLTRNYFTPVNQWDTILSHCQNEIRNWQLPPHVIWGDDSVIMSTTISTEQEAVSNFLCTINLFIDQWSQHPSNTKISGISVMSHLGYNTRQYLLQVITKFIPVFCAPALDEADTDRAHSRQLIYCLKSLINRVPQKLCKCLIVKDLQMTTCKKTKQENVWHVLTKILTSKCWYR